MNCPYCQTPNRDGAKRCSHCGQVLPAAPQPAMPGQMPPQPMPAYPPQAPPAYPQVPGVPPLPPAQAKPSLLQRVRRKEVGLGCLLLLVGFLFGILGTMVVQLTLGNSATPTPAVAAKPEKGFRPPAFKLQTIDNKDVEFPKALESQAGVLVFWTSDPKNDDQMNRLQALASDKLKVFSVTSNDTQAKARQYVDGKGWTRITTLLDGNEEAKQAYQITNVPTYFLISKEGTIVDILGNVKPEDLEKKINDELLK